MRFGPPQDAPPPDRPDWLEVGALLVTTVQLTPDRYDNTKLVYGGGSLIFPANTPAVYMGEERITKPDRKGNQVRILVHAFFVGGAKRYTEVGYFRPYDLENPWRMHGKF